MSTSIVIPLATGSTASRWGDNTELRYALRGVEKYLRGVGEIFVIGKAPRWLRNVTVIPATDHERTYYKERNIFNKIMLACQDSRVSEDFLFMNDDHFLLQEFEAGSFPYYYDGYLSTQAKRSDPYGNTARNTALYLKFECVPFFDVHAPILYNKCKFPLVGRADWNKKYGYCIKTTYCLTNGLFIDHPRTEVSDLKITGAMSTTQIKNAIAGRPFFSTADNVRDGAMGAVMEELYPSRSKYEK